MRPLTRPASDADADADQEPGLGRPAPPADRHAGPDAGERQGRADRQVEDAGDHQEHHAGDEDAVLCRVEEHGGDVEAGREVVGVDDRPWRRRAARSGRTASVRANWRAAGWRGRGRSTGGLAEAAARRLGPPWLGSPSIGSDVSSWQSPRKRIRAGHASSMETCVKRVARRSTASSSAVSTGEIADRAAVGHDDDAVGEGQHFRQVGGDDQERHARGRRARAGCGRSRPVRRHRRLASARRR